jgi:hypothetical protein
MVEKVTAVGRSVWLLLGLLALPSTGLAHRLDEYLQATLVTIEPGGVRLQMNFTPGVAVAERVLAQIDRDRDNVISPAEAAAYAELVRRDLTLLLDQRKLSLKLTASSFPVPAELRTGWGFIQMEFSAPVSPLSPGLHKLTLRNRHLPSLSVYLFNAAKPGSDQIRITRQTRNKNQRTGEIEFVITPLESPSRAMDSRLP